jgi:hydroxypyruvate reductase
MSELGARALAVDIFLDVTARIDAERLVRSAEQGAAAIAAATHVLAVGKAAFPMLAGARAVAGARPALVVAPESRIPAVRPADVEVHAGDHPLPTARSVAAARAAQAFVRARSPGERLLVLLSGGTSSLVCAPAPPLGLEDKRAAVAAVARGGAPIAALNALRKHLSAIKGGRLGLEARVPVTVLALSDVVGNDPAVIGSGLFSGDGSTYQEALEVLEKYGGRKRREEDGDQEGIERVRGVLEEGARGEREETPKPGDPRLSHVKFRVLAGPARVTDEARASAARMGLRLGWLWRDTELDVAELAQVAVERAAREAAAGGPPLAVVGNGEPSIRLPAGAGMGGRASHLALLVARGLRDLPEQARRRVAFLAVGTDDRDGNAPATGAAVDAGTFARAAARGVDADAALRRFDSFRALAPAGDVLIGPGTSNLLDLHVLVVA